MPTLPLNLNADPDTDGPYTHAGAYRRYLSAVIERENAAGPYPNPPDPVPAPNPTTDVMRDGWPGTIGRLQGLALRAYDQEDIGLGGRCTGRPHGRPQPEGRPQPGRVVPRGPDLPRAVAAQA